MSSCYSLNLDLIKFNPPTTFSASSSPSSNSGNSPRSILARDEDLRSSAHKWASISTRKARAPRKRPNQTYNEAASILSTAYPKVFPLSLKSTKSLDNRSPPPFLSHPDDQLLQQGPLKKTESRLLNSFAKACEAESRVYNCEIYDDDFSAESMLDEEIEEGIDSIMGKGAIACDSVQVSAGLGVEFGCGVRREIRAMRHVDEGDWWRFPCVNVAEITQQIPEENKKKKNSAKKLESSAFPLPNEGLRLKLDYDAVLKAWSDKGSPFAGDAPGAESAGNDVQVRLSQIAEGGAVVLRYKEIKRCTRRLFSKKPTSIKSQN